jgi:hypothetical protein
MPEQPPQQIFDGSFFEAILSTPELKVLPPQVEIETADETRNSDDLEALREIETFDWESYNRAFFERIPESAKRTDEGRRMAEIAGTQIWMSRRLPPEVLSYLLRVTPTKLLWSYLNGDDRKELLKTVTRGFQRTPQIVRQPVVRNRWLGWLGQNPAEIYVLLVMWSFTEPQPPVIAFAQDESDDEALKRKLPAMFRKFGIEATLSGLSMAARPRVFRAVAELLDDKDELARLMQDDNDESDETNREAAQAANAAQVQEESLYPPDSDSALYWRNKFEEVNATRARLAESLEQVLDKSERLDRAIARQKNEMELLHKREQVATAQWEKKLEGVQKRLHAEADELRKNFERQGRKMRALERDKAELDTENRRFKKQLRHTGLLLEEERRKVANLEAQARQGKADAPVEAILTPSASQGAPNKTVVVQSPTPLDEIFEWRADGRPVKITPRALRRLIDSNDEDAVFTIMQALESLRHSDKSTYGKFLKRLGEAGAYYSRVLTERTTRVLVDASNVARHMPNRYGKGQLRHLLEMREELRRLNCFPIVFYADASLRYFIDDANQFRDMVQRGEILVVDKGTEADEILAREARRSGAYVVTNDAKFFHKVSPDFEPPRVSFRIYDGTVIVDDF